MCEFIIIPHQYFGSNTRSSKDQSSPILSSLMAIVKILFFFSLHAQKLFLEYETLWILYKMEFLMRDYRVLLKKEIMNLSSWSVIFIALRMLRCGV